MTTAGGRVGLDDLVEVAFWNKANLICLFFLLRQAHLALPFP